MNKKAIFMPVLSFFILITLTYAYYELIIKDDSSGLRIIGLNQAEIIKSYNKGEEYSLNAEYAVKYSADLTIYNFSKNSGIPEACGNLWEFNSKCSPDLEKNFIEMFNEYLLNYGYKPRNTEIKNNFIIVDLEDFSYEKDLGRLKFEYSLPLKLRKELNIDLNNLNNIKEKLIKCDKEGKDLNTCINEKSKIENEIITFTIENNKNLIIYTDRLEIINQNFVFKINPKKTGLSRGVF